MLNTLWRQLVTFKYFYKFAPLSWIYICKYVFHTYFWMKFVYHKCTTQKGLLTLHGCLTTKIVNTLIRHITTFTISYYAVFSFAIFIYFKEMQPFLPILKKCIFSSCMELWFCYFTVAGLIMNACMCCCFILIW